MKNNKIEKIIFTGQALRVNWEPVFWMYELLRYTIEEISGLKFYCTAPINKKEMYPEERYIPYDVKKIYESYGYEFSYKKNTNPIPVEPIWIKIFYNKEYNKEAYDYIYSIFKNSLVISFEVEDVISSALSYFNIPHIDMNLDPIRFLPDLMLCFKTKIKDVYEKILKYRVSEEFIYMHANYIRALYNQQSRPIGNNVLFLGQTRNDKSLIDPKTNEVYSILDHKKEFEKLVKGFDNILYKPHPYATPEFDAPRIKYLKTLNNIKIIDDNFYKLCSRSDIKKIVSISSGTCSEARYFGKEVQNLLKEGVPRQIEDKFDENKYVSIYGDFFSLNFWADILSPLIKTKKYDNLISIQGRNMLRNSRLDNALYYSYQNLDIIKIEDRIRKTVLTCEAVDI